MQPQQQPKQQPPRSARGVFVTGTGTEVGKTLVAAVIAREAALAGRTVAVFKPAVTGLDDYPASGKHESRWEEAAALPDHLLLRLAAGSVQSVDEIAPYRYGPPVSPHLAAELTGEPIDPARLRDAVRVAGDHGYLVCEGVGGFLVPLTPDYLVRDFARELALPVVIAASPGLGTINQTLLTIEAVRAAGLELRFVVLTPWPERPSPLECDNLRTVARLGDVEVKTLPRLQLSSPERWPGL